MGYISITEIKFSKATTKTDENFLISVSFDSVKDINREVTWKCLYISDPSDESNDILLDEIIMDSIESGSNTFDWEIESPDYSKLQNQFDIFDSSVIIFSVSIADQDFFRCSYFIIHEYNTEELNDDPPSEIDWDNLIRIVKTDNPIVNVKQIDWENILDDKNKGDKVKLGDHQFQNIDMLG